MDYMLVARSKSADGFSNEPGAVYFFGVPSDEDAPKFRHKMSPRTWRDAVLEQASSGTRNTQTTGDIVFMGTITPSKPFWNANENCSAGWNTMALMGLL